MRVIAFDTETGLIRPGMQAPELVCVTWADGPERAGILHWSEAVPHLAEWLRDPSTLLVGHNTAYDLAVICQHDPRLLPLVFDALEAGRITCTMLRAQLQDCAAGTLQSGKKVPLPVAPGAKKPKSLGAYSLAGQVFTLFGQDISEGKSGPDVWRLRYAELRSIPLRDWPEAARGYAVSDAQWTWSVYQAQAARANPSDVFGPEFHESRSAFASARIRTRWRNSAPIASITPISWRITSAVRASSGRTVRRIKTHCGPECPPHTPASGKLRP